MAIPPTTESVGFLANLIMTTEEKAKAYDEAINTVINLAKAGLIYEDAAIQVFPELKKFEDERIRKDLIERFEGFPDMIWRGHYKKDILSWLERQSEQKPIKEHNACDFCEDKYGCVSPCPTKLIDEQKPADKVEPKFKVGDWIIKNDDSFINIDYSCCKITKVENGNYTIESIYGYKGYNTFETFEKDYHLWTIQDAKDGDVLVTKNKNIFIFKSISDCIIYGYCGLYFGKFESSSAAVNCTAAIDYVPATKEQRDLLFSKIKEPGYEWDEENKELKKIVDEKQIKKNLQDNGFRRMFEQKSSWSEENETVLNNLIYALANDRIGNDRDEYISWLKSLRPQSQWKPSDEQMLSINTAISVLGKGTISGKYLIELQEQLKKLRGE